MAFTLSEKDVYVSLSDLGQETCNSNLVSRGLARSAKDAQLLLVSAAHNTSESSSLPYPPLATVTGAAEAPLDSTCNQEAIPAASPARELAYSLDTADICDFKRCTLVHLGTDICCPPTGSEENATTSSTPAVQARNLTQSPRHGDTEFTSDERKYKGKTLGTTALCDPSMIQSGVMTSPVGTSGLMTSGPRESGKYLAKYFPEAGAILDGIQTQASSESPLNSDDARSANMKHMLHGTIESDCAVTESPKVCTGSNLVLGKRQKDYRVHLKTLGR